MATANPRNIRRFRGRIAWAPTSLTAAFPHGGTELGVIRDATFKPGFKYEEIRAEEYGNVPTEYVYDGSHGVFMAVLRGFDNDALSTIFPDTTTGSATGDQILRADVSGSVTLAGTLISTNSGILVVSPNSPETEEFLVLYNAMPMVEAQAQLQYKASEEVGMAVVFGASPDATGRQWNIGKRRDLSL